MQIDKEGFPARLRQIGEERYKSMAAFARALGMKSPQQLYEYLSGKSLPGNKLQDKMRELKIDVTWLLTGKRMEELKSDQLKFAGELKDSGPLGYFSVIDKAKFFREEEIVLKIITSLVSAGSITIPEDLDESMMRRLVRMYRVGMDEIQKPKEKGE